jgi:Flp pilus assembly protein TadD
MWALLTALFVAAAVPGLDDARDKQDVPALQRFVEDAAGAAAKAPNDAAAQYRMALASSYLAEVAQELRDKKRARDIALRGIKAAERAVVLSPDAENYRILGTLCGQAITDLFNGLSYGPRAKSAINKAVELAPKSSPMYVARGVGNYYLPSQLGGGVETALADFRKAVELDPRNAEAHLWLGLGLRKLNRNAEARAALAKAVTLAPNRIWAKQELDKTPAK